LSKCSLSRDGLGSIFLGEDFFCRFKAPAPFDGINVNFCRNPKCANFGVPETPNRGKRRTTGAPPQPGDYSLETSGKGKPILKCMLCDEGTPMRSNRLLSSFHVKDYRQMVAFAKPVCDRSNFHVIYSSFPTPALTTRAQRLNGSTSGPTHPR